MPDLMRQVRQEDMRYITQLRKWENDEDYDSHEIQAAFVDLLNRMVDVQLKVASCLHVCLWG